MVRFKWSSSVIWRADTSDLVGLHDAAQPPATSQGDVVIAIVFAFLPLRRAIVASTVPRSCPGFVGRLSVCRLRWVPGLDPDSRAISTLFVWLSDAPSMTGRAGIV